MGESSVGKLKRLQEEVTAALTTDAVTPGATAPDSKFHRSLRFCSLVARGFWNNRLQVRAAALAYTTLLALVPLLAVSLSVASLVFDVKKTESRVKLTGQIEQFVTSVAPTLGLEDQDGSAQRAKVANTILDFAEKINFGTIGVTAMAGLIFVAISLLRTVEHAFNDIWSITRGRSWFDSIVMYWAAITLGPIVLLVAMTSGYLNALQGGTSWIQSIPGVVILKTSLLPVMLLCLLFAGLYKLMPNTRVSWQAAIVGGIVAALLWWGNNKLGAMYNTRVLTYSKIYGSLGAVPLFLAGMYLSWTILLLGAQTAYTFQFRHAYLQDRQAEQIHQQGREFIALRFMAEIGRRFVLKQPPIAASEMAERFGVPNRLASKILQTLSEAGLLHEVEGLEPAFVPAQPLAQIRVQHVLHALRASQGHELATPDDSMRLVVRAEFDAIRAAEDSRANAVSIDELVARSLGNHPS
jgi:membrane protein